METSSKPSERWNPSKNDVTFSGRMLPHYAPSTSYHKPAFEKDKGKDKDRRDDRGNPKSAVRAQVTQVEPDSEPEFRSSAESNEEGLADENALWRDGYYCCAIRNVDQSETFFGACFNCRDQGHRW